MKSVYTGYPMPLNIESLEYMTRASKHNVKSANRTMNYENGRLVSEISNDDHTIDAEGTVYVGGSAAIVAQGTLFPGLRDL